MHQRVTLSGSIFCLVALVGGYLALQVILNTLYLIDQPDLGLWGGVMVYGALFEELVKFSIAYGIYQLCKLPSVAVFVGVGYGLGERLLYWTASGTLILHDFGALGMHFVAGFSSAYFFHQYKITSSRRHLALALIVPVLVHGAYNTIIWAWYQWVLLGM